MKHRIPHANYRRMRLQVESLETRRLLAVLNVIPTLNPDAGSTPLLVAPQQFESVIVTDTTNGLVYNIATLDIGANQGAFLAGTNGSALTFNNTTVDGVANALTDGSLFSIVNGYDADSYVPGVFWFNESSTALHVQPANPEPGAQAELTPSVIGLGRSGTTLNDTVPFEAIDYSDPGRAYQAPTITPEFSLDQFDRTDLQLAHEPLIQIEPNRNLIETVPGPASNVESTLTQQSVARGSESLSATSLIDIARNESLTSFVAPTVEADPKAAPDARSDVREESDSAEVVFRVEPVMARHHTIELRRVTTAPRVTELPTDLPAHAMTPVAMTPVMPTTTGVDSFHTHITRESRRSNNAANRPAAGATSDNDASTVSGLQQAIAEPAGETAVVLINDDDATVGDEHSSGKWQTAIDVLMAATAGAVIYTQRERVTSDRGTEFRLR